MGGVGSRTGKGGPVLAWGLPDRAEASPKKNAEEEVQGEERLAVRRSGAGAIFTRPEALAESKLAGTSSSIRTHRSAHRLTTPL